MHRHFSLFVALVASSAGLVVLLAQAPAAVVADADYLRHAYESYTAMRQASPHKSASWMFLGPTNISGRATDIAVANRNGQRRIYAGYATGGVWKSDDNGASWQAIFENMPSTSIGDLAVAPSNPDIVWVGTGEANIFRASMPGVGIYKSTDAGVTWQHMGLTDTQTIARIIVDPANADIVYVAASGHEWTDNAERGVFKTTDGGRTWSKILYKSPRTGAIDLVMDPKDSTTLYAAMWQRIRRKWSDPRVEPGYDEGGVFKTTDAGRTWTDVSQGLPAPQYRGRIGIDISRSNPNVLYALVDNYEIGRMPAPGERDPYDRPMPAGKGFIKGADVYRSDDAGKTWRETSRFDQATSTYLDNHSGHVRVGVRADSRRSRSAGRRVHARPRIERLARRGEDLLAHRRHARRSPRALDRSRGFVGDVQRERWRRVPDERRGQAVEVRGLGAHDAVLRHRARHGAAGARLRLDPGHRQHAGGDRRPREPRDPPDRLRARAGRRGIEPRGRSQQPEHRVLALVLRRVHAYGPLDRRGPGRSGQGDSSARS